MARTPTDIPFEAEIAEEDKRARKEDYKAYTERDVDEGWPYSDDPAGEDDRLEENRPYAAEDAAPIARTGAEADRAGVHLEEADPVPVDGGPLEEDGDETVEEYTKDSHRREGERG